MANGAMFATTADREQIAKKNPHICAPCWSSARGSSPRAPVRMKDRAARSASQRRVTDNRATGA
jgi:hypothetical protein